MLSLSRICTSSVNYHLSNGVLIRPFQHLFLARIALLCAQDLWRYDISGHRFVGGGGWESPLAMGKSKLALFIQVTYLYRSPDFYIALRLHTPFLVAFYIQRLLYSLFRAKATPPPSNACSYQAVARSLQNSLATTRTTAGS